MRLECVRAFGYWKRGDVIVVPDCDRFDHVHFRETGKNITHALPVQIDPIWAAWIFKTRIASGFPDIRKVTRYMLAMIHGEWRPDSEIGFHDGRLHHGQHRMLAVARSGAPQTFMVTKRGGMPVRPVHLPEWKLWTATQLR